MILKLLLIQLLLTLIYSNVFDEHHGAAVSYKGIGKGKGTKDAKPVKSIEVLQNTSEPEVN